MNLYQFFDPNNIEHIKAYEHLHFHGSWSRDFWEKIKDMEIPNGWTILLAEKMANCWVEHMLKRKE